MEESALLAEFLALVDNTPEFANFTPTSRIYHEERSGKQWVGENQ
jgi:hypothetical protein